MDSHWVYELILPHHEILGPENRFPDEDSCKRAAVIHALEVIAERNLDAPAGWQDAGWQAINL
jgi:hypothetical protein